MTVQATGIDPFVVAQRLEDVRSERTPAVERLGRYYRGVADLPPIPARLSTTYRALLQRSNSNWMRLVVDACAERLTVEGFRTSDSPEADSTVWKWWQANNLDAASRQVHTEAIKSGITYVAVWPNPDGEHPLIRAEHPAQVYAEYDAEDQHKATSALKVWKGTDGLWYATLYLPDSIYRWQSARPDPEGNTPPAFKGSAWIGRQDDTGPAAPNPFDGEVPFVPFRNSPDILGAYQSDIEPVIPIQDRINTTLFNRLLAAEFSAFRQKWATGIDVPVDPDTGEQREPYNAAVDRLWVSENPDARFGEFGETGLGGYISAIESDIQHLAAITRTPPHYLLGQSGAFPSGESLKATETGLMAKVHEKSVYFGEDWEHVIRLAAKAASYTIEDEASLETLWKNTESRTTGELVDALVKLGTLGVPKETLWELYGFSPQAIERMNQMEPTDAVAALAQAIQGKQAAEGNGPPPEVTGEKQPPQAEEAAA